MRNRGKCAGFTLIELLVVIAIIAILAGMLFPVFVSAKSAANKTKCLSNMKQLGVAFAQYKNDWGCFFPRGGNRDVTGSDMSGEWQNVIFRYMKTEQVYRCPSCLCRQPDWNSADPTSPGPNRDLPRTAITYLYNVQLGADNVHTSQQLLTPRSHHESEVIRPSKCVLLMEGNAYGRQPGYKYTGIDARGRKKSQWLWDQTFGDSASSITGGDRAKKSYGLPYHADGGNISYVDGHSGYKRYNSSGTLQAVLPYAVHVRLDAGLTASGMGMQDTWQK